MNSAYLKEFYYNLAWRPHGLKAGMHSSKTIGGNTDFNTYQHFLNAPNPSRIDVRRSLMMIPRTLMVRSYYERSAIQVFAVVDTSSSMHFVGHTDKWHLVAQIASSIAWSTTRQGDGFNLIAGDDISRNELFIHRQYKCSVAQEVYKKLMTVNPVPLSSFNAFPQLASYLSHKKSLVFFISDFHATSNTLQANLQSIAMHDVVPIVLWDRAEYEDIPSWGWARMRDMETGQDNALFIRPKLLKKIKDYYSEQRSDLVALSRKLGIRKPFFVEEYFDVRQLSQHLLAM